MTPSLATTGPSMPAAEPAAEVAELPAGRPEVVSPTSECCAWCGLPLRIPPRRRQVQTATAVVQSDESESPGSHAAAASFCCLGCRIAKSLVEDRGEQGEARGLAIRLGLAVFFSMNLMAFTMVCWSPEIYGAAVGSPALLVVFRTLSLVLSLPVLILLGVPLVQSGLAGFRRDALSTDLLIVVGVTTAWLISTWNVITNHGPVYFEVGAGVLVMVTLGRWFEAVGRQKAVASLDALSALLPATARRQMDSGWQECRSEELVTGNILQIRPGDRFPTDGRVVNGQTTVDEQVFTGESTPVFRTCGDRVLAGTCNLESPVEMEVECRFREGSFGRLLDVMQQARLSRGRYQILADQITAWFLPMIGLIALGTLLGHGLFTSAGFGPAVQHSLSVLLISCPCALGLATPLAVWTALSTGVRRQVLFRSGDAIERLATINAVCFDKTGTLTTGHPQVRQMVCFNSESDVDALALAAGLAATSTHPFSRAVCEYAAERTSSEPLTAPEQLRDVRSLPGKGVSCRVGHDDELRIGSITFALADAELQPQQRLQLGRILANADQSAASVVAFSRNRQPVAIFVLAETVRPDAPGALRGCRDLNLHLTVLTGDRASRGEELSRSLTAMLQEHAIQSGTSVSPEPGLSVQSDLQPEDKVARLLAVRERFGAVGMVGDGVNDAPALAASDVGIALACGADVSRNSAHVCLLTSQLDRLPWAIRLARRTRAVIRRNLIWAFGYNSIGVVCAAMGLLNPVIAAALMIVSSLVVISNSLRLMPEPVPDGGAP